MKTMKVVVIFCFCAGVAIAQNSTYGSLPKGEYEDPITTDSGSLAGLIAMATGFVDIVFPTFISLSAYVTSVLRASDQFNYLQANWQDLAKLQAGFIACLVFGVLFIVLVPIVGAIMCCCRTCCNNCGGKMQQSSERSKSCWRQCLCLSMLILTILMAIPTIFVFLTNDWIGQVVDEAPDNAGRILNNTGKYIQNVNDQFDYVVDQYGVLDKSLRSMVGDLGSSVGEKAEEIANDLASDSLGHLDKVISDVDTVKGSLDEIAQAVNNLGTGLTELNSQLSNQTTKMQTGLTTCQSLATTDACKQVYDSAGNLKVNIDQTKLDDLVAELQPIVAELESYDLKELRENTTNEIDSISEKVTDQTTSISNKAITELDKANNTFTTLRSEIPLEQIDGYQDQISSLSNTIKTSVNNYDDNFDNYRYIAGAVLGSILAVIVLSYFVGVILGTCGYDKRADPSDRSCLSNCGGIFLMVGVGLSFIFSWLLMILVVLTFSLGGFSERYVCQPISKPYDGLMLIEESIPNFNLSTALGVSGVSFQGILRACTNDTSVYNVLKLKNQFDLDKLISDINEQFDLLVAEVNSTDVDLSSLNFFDQGVEDGLGKVNNSGLADLDFTTYEEEVNKTATDPDLNVYAASLNVSADNYQPAQSLEANRTRGYSYDIMQIQTNYVDPLQGYLDTIQENIDKIKTVQNDVTNSINALSESLKDLDAEVSANGKELILNATTPIVEEILIEVKEYLNWLVEQIKENFGACKPIADTYDQTVALLCDYFVDTLSALWFSLGWCVFLLIPSAIVAMKLAKFYRILSYSEEYEE